MSPSAVAHHFVQTPQFLCKTICSLLKCLSHKHIAILVLTIVLQYQHVNAKTNWLLEHSFHAKPIYMLKDDSFQWPAHISETCRTQLDVMLNQQPLVEPWALESKSGFVVAFACHLSNIRLNSARLERCSTV